MTDAPRHLLLVLMNAKPDRVDEFNAWYDDHIGDAIQLDGWASAQRFRLADTEPPQDAPFEYLAIYEIEDLDVARAAVDTARRLRDEAGNHPTTFLHTSDAKGPGKQMLWWTAITPRSSPRQP